MSPEGQSQSAVADNSQASPPDFQAMKSFIEAEKALSSDASFKGASAVMDETTKLKRQVESKDEELAKLRAKINDLERTKETVYNEMFEANQKEKNKQAEILARVTDLQATVREKENALTEQQKMIDVLKIQIEKLETMHENEKAKAERAHKDVDELQQKLKDRDDLIENMKEAESTMKENLTTAEGKVQELEKTNASLTEQLETSSARLKELEGFAVEFHDESEESLLNKFFNLWESASQAVVFYLKDDVSTEALQNNQAWKRMRVLGDQRHQVPLPQTNSEAAKQMRLAVILAILAREIDKHIFQPTYILPEGSGTRELLTDLAMKNSKKESFCRAVLLSIDPDTQAKNLEDRTKQVVENVASHLSGLLSETQYNGISRSLEEVVKNAAEVWKTIQHARERYETDFDPLEWGDTEYDPFPFAGDANAAGVRAAGGDDDENLLIVFPRICRVQNNERYPRNYATSLRRSQCMAAERELKRKEPSSPTVSRVASDRQRARGMSIALNNMNSPNGHFLDKASPSAAQSGG